MCWGKQTQHVKEPGSVGINSHLISTNVSVGVLRFAMVIIRRALIAGVAILVLVSSPLGVSCLGTVI